MALKETYMIIDCVSDLHGYLPELEGGDLLILAGDYTANDRIQGWNKFFDWLDNQNYRKKIMIAGNHDNFCKSWATSNDSIHDILAGKPSVSYLCDSGEEFEGLKIWGSPWSKTFPGINPHCCAFTVDTDEQLAEKWVLIPPDTDILITHSPSFGNFDIVQSGESVGSLALWIMCLGIKPKLHVFGHIHEAYGEAKHYNGIHLVNASYVNERYQPVNKPIRVIL